MLKKKKLTIILKLTVVLLLFTAVFNQAELKAAVEIKKDIIIYTAEPEGVAAAAAAARENKRVLLVMSRENPGGLMTYGGLNFLDLNYNQSSQNINQGIFAEWHRKVGSSISFSPKKAEKAFKEILRAEANIEIINSASLKKIELEAGKIASLEIKTADQNYRLKADYFIDASQDGDLAALAGEDYFVGTADISLPSRWMASTQILKFSNIEAEKLKKAVKNNQFKNTYFKADHAWGFSEFGKAYQSQHPSMRLRGLNIVLIKENSAGNLKAEKNTTAYINALLLFELDPLSEASIKKAQKRAAAEAESVLKYLQVGLPGFKEAELAQLPPELYRRESRHFLTEYQLDVKDQFRQKVFKDAVTSASYPLDYQASALDYPGFVLFNPDYYTIPLRSLLARKNKNLLIVGRSSGYSSLAAASARVLPVGMNTAEAAAAAAAEAINKNKTLLEIAADKESLNKIRSQLELDFENYPAENPLIKDQQLLEAVEKLLSWGITIGGYNNNFKLTQKPLEKEFTAIILKIMQKKEAYNLYEWVPGSLETLSKNRRLNSQNALKLLLAAESRPVLEIAEKDYYAKALSLDLIPADLKNILKQKKLLSRKEMLILAAHYLDRFETPSDLKFIRGENSE